MKQIYLAGCIGKYYYDGCIEKATKWRKNACKFFKRFSNDFCCFNQMDFYSYGGDDFDTDIEVMRYDLRAVRESQIVLVNLEDLGDSLGTSDEILYAYIKGTPIIGFLESEEKYDNSSIRHVIHPWKVDQCDKIFTGEDAQIKAMEYIKSHY